MTCRRWPPSPTSPVVDGTFIWTASHDQWQCSLSTVSFPAAIVLGPEPRSSWSAHSEARTNDLDGGENVGDQLDLPAGGCEDGAVAITEGDRTLRAAAPSFRAERRFGRGNPILGAWRQGRPELLILASGSVSDRGVPVRVISEPGQLAGPSG
jgi:hypothetical protein